MKRNFSVGQEITVNGAWARVECLLEEENGCYVSDQDGGEKFVSFDEID